MKKARKFCALILGISISFGTSSHAAEIIEQPVSPEIVLDDAQNVEKILEEKTSLEEVERDIDTLNNLLPAQKKRFSLQEQMTIETITELSREDAISTAEAINQIQDEKLYETALHEVLNAYYDEESFNISQITAFSSKTDSRANSMLADYAEAKAERDKQNLLNYKAGEVLITFKDGTTEEQIAEIANYIGGSYHILRTFPINENLPECDLKRLEKVKDYKFPLIVAMNIGLDMTVEKAKKLLGTLDCVSHVEMDGIVRNPVSIQSDFGVNDTKVNEQTYLNQIQATQAWKTYQSSGTEVLAQETYVAVIDTGLDITHEDLKNQYSKELSISFVKNGNSVDIQPMNLNNCYLRDYVTYADHGTEVASVIAAESNNKKGIVGIASPEGNLTKIIAINLYYQPYIEDGKKQYHFENKSLIEAIRYAVSNGARVINMSLGISWEDPDVQDVINYAHEADVVLCGAVGNNGKNESYCPANFNHVISVASVNKDNTRASFSNYHNTVDLAAPGVDIYVCTLNNGYISSGGTSLSTPMVSAAAAILASMRSVPTDKILSADEIESILCETATDLFTPGKDIYSGYGLLNINLALQTAKQKFISNIAPTNMQAVAKNYNSIALHWKGITWAERYLIFRSTEPNGTYTKIASLHCDTTCDTNSNGNGYWWYKDSNRATGTRYYYKIRAAISYKDSFRFSNYTPIVNAVCTLNTPTGLSLTSTTGKITAAWQKVDGAEGYQIWRSESKNGTYKRIHTITSGTILSYSDATPKAGTTYYYKIRAYRKPNGTAIFSNFSAIATKKAK